VRAPLVLALILCACARQAPAPQDRLPTLPAPPETEVVATVNGQPITIADVTAQARATGKAPKEALEDLVRAEALVQVADQRGLAGDPEVRRRAREEMTRRYLNDTFEKEVTPETAVTTADIRKAYQQASGRLVHPLLKEVDHILVKSARADDKAAALAAEIRQRALATRSADDFNKVTEQLRDAAKAAGFDLLNERVVTARQGWTVEEFAKASFELKVGEISPVTRTSFGYHVIRLQREIPAENVTIEQATPRIREDLYPKARAREFQRWVERLAMKHQVTLYPERLKDLQQAEQGAR
jgi:peptidyl-prolyl cis-trans isomerase C